MSNIRATIMEFDDTEKVVNTIDTLGGTQQVSFLTEKGLYKVLFRSRKPIAQKFQNWVCQIIKEIRLKGIYDLHSMPFSSIAYLYNLKQYSNYVNFLFHPYTDHALDCSKDFLELISIHISL